MTGTGTQTDPFVITTIEELMTMNEWSTVQSYVALGANLDFSDIADPQPIILKCKELDGCGHTIRGIYVTKPKDDISIFLIAAERSILYVDIKNIKIEADQPVLNLNTQQIYFHFLQHPVTQHQYL